MLRGDEPYRMLLDLGHCMTKDFTARHVMLVKGTHCLKVAFILGEQRRFVRQSPEDIAGEQHARMGIEGADSAGEMGVGRENKVQAPVCQLQLPVVLVNQPKRQP